MDKMLPENSPQKHGVRRMNNIPLFLVLGALLVFVLLIGMVAFKRANAQATESKPEKTPRNQETQNTQMMVEAVMRRKKLALVVPVNPPVMSDAGSDNAQITLPVALVDNPNAVPKPPIQEPVNPEMERIRNAKIQAFEEAVKASTHVAYEKPEVVTKVRVENALISDETAQFKQKLQAQLNPQANHWALGATVEAQTTPYTLRTGAVIPGVMVSGINSELPGQIIGQISEDVYDTATGRYLLIPQGTKLFGMYASDVVYGQDAVLIAWQRIIFPNGDALDIGSMPGTDGAGYSGFRDGVDNHYGRIFGGALLMTGITAGVTYSQNNNNNQGPYAQPNASSVLSEALGQQLGQVSAQLIAKNLNIAPTLTIRPGYRFNVLAVKDILLAKPYRREK